FRPNFQRRLAQNLLFDLRRQGQRLELPEILLDVWNAGAGPIGAEQRLVRDLLQARKITEQLLWRDTADIEMHVAMPPQQEKRRLHPDGAPAVGHQDSQLGEIHGYVVNINGIAEFVAGVGKDRGTSMDHYGNAVGFS